MISVFQLTVEKLLSTPEISNSSDHTDQRHKRTHSHHLSHVSLLQQCCDNVPEYHLASNVIAEVRWTEAEKRLLVKSLQLHHKDFSRVQKAVSLCHIEGSFWFCGRAYVCLCSQIQTKSISECVEFYYLWKKKMNPSTRGLTVNREFLSFQFNSHKQIRSWTQSSALRWSSCIVS